MIMKKFSLKKYTTIQFYRQQNSFDITLQIKIIKIIQGVRYFRIPLGLSLKPGREFKYFVVKV